MTLEVRLIGRNNDLIGQILEVFESKKKNRKKKEYSVRQIVDEQEYSKSAGERVVS
jgi:hypothetical protein